MNVVRLLHAGFLLVAACAFGAPVRVLLLAGDESHGWGQHKHVAGTTLLLDALRGQAEAEMIREWPAPEKLAAADALVIYADGWAAHPANGHLEELERFMNRSKGLVAIHWATGIGAGRPGLQEQGGDPLRVRWRGLMGADFETYHSISNFWPTEFGGGSEHPVMRGVEPFTVFDECYFHLREAAGGVTRVWKAQPPPWTIEPGLSPFRGNDKARESLLQRHEEQFVSWTFERPQGGRAFGYTGGHFHWNWANDGQRKMVLNGILWAAGSEVPAQGVESARPDAKRMLGVLQETNPRWTETGLQAALDRMAAGQPVPWLAYTGGPLPEPLFDGGSLDGWEVRTGEEKWWSVADGVIRGGSLDETVPHNTFIATTKRYANFELRFKVRMVEGEGFMNSGVQLRSIRVPGNSEMSGYQVDIGPDWWGKLYDESRRNRVLGEPVDPAGLASAVREWDWNEFRVVCEGPHIRSWINGVPALDHTEAEPEIPLEGRIGLQAHGGGRFLVEFKDLAILEMPPTPGVRAWPKESPLSPDDERGCLKVPEGFEVELVASEEQGVGKPITVAWDRKGRLWTMTALEYPVDANENPEQAEALFAAGGRDKVLVFEDCQGPGPHQPRVFAEGLAIPLGLLPVPGGALVQYGHEIRCYTDDDGDGRADGHRTVLEGFGIQDSHLFAHQFERAPGGWIYVAQGRFNNSAVRRPGGAPFADGRTEVPFLHCKLGRMRRDGSAFEVLTTGPNNIWGLATARDGEVFLQEANDLGIPVAEFLEGTYYDTGSTDRLRPYAPQIPPSLPDDRMGGTGLSGLAIAEDEGSSFADGYGTRKVFYLANPITNRVQVVSFERDAGGPPQYRKEADFLTSSDPWFRPVALHFGPDGALYVVDWYNKIISHNEVPRTHPDRDKTRGRIWRIKPRGVVLERPPDLEALGTGELVDLLGAPNARIARMAWQELGDRGDASVLPVLESMSLDRSAPVSRRLGALWAVEEMGRLDPGLADRLSRDSSAQVRYEAVRAADRLGLSSEAFGALLDEDEKDFRVKVAWMNALRRQSAPGPERIGQLLRVVGRMPGGSPRADYERDFLRYLARWAMESHPGATRSWLEGAAVGDVEARSLAALALPPEEGAARLLAVLPDLRRALGADELGLLGGQLKQAAVAGEFGRLLGIDETREGMLRALLQLDPAAAANPELRAAVGGAVGRLLADRPEAAALAVSVVRHFRLSALAPQVVAAAESGKAPWRDALRALNEVGAPDAALCRRFLDDGDPELARAALRGFASAGGTEAVEEIGRRWNGLDANRRQVALDGILSGRGTAEAFVDAAGAGGFSGFGGAAMEKVIVQLGRDHPKVAALMRSVEGLLAPVIRLRGGGGDKVSAAIDLVGPFTLEGWIKFDEGIGNEDNLLGRKGGADFNFHDARFRVFAGGKDRIIATRPVTAGVWTHVAITRDDDGRFAIYQDGERDPAEGEPYVEPMMGLHLGESTPSAGSGAAYVEVRVWDRARTADEIRGDRWTSFAGGTAPGHLVRRLSGDTPDLPLEGGAKVAWESETPALRTPAQAQAEAERFAAYRRIAEREGDVAKGRLLVEARCMTCHRIGAEGTALGPDLSGAGAMGIEALLRNILYPNDQLESGYYRHDVTLNDGSLVSGFLVSENGGQVVIRPVGADERVLPRSQIATHSVARRTLMPEGLIDGMSEGEVADLFSYLGTLR